MSEALHLYHSLLRQASRLASYNFRQYAIRRVRDGFLSNRDLTDRREIQKELAFGAQQLEVIKRQVAISRMYKEQKLVIETGKAKTAIEGGKAPAIEN